MLTSQVDTNRYVVRVDATRGIVTIFWKESEREQHEEDFRRIRSELDKVEGARKMALSCSATMTLYTSEQCAERLLSWYHWHQHWVYGTTPSVKLPAAMPLNQSAPHRRAPLQGTSGVQSPVDPDFHDGYGYMELFTGEREENHDKEDHVVFSDSGSDGGDDLSITADFSEPNSDTSSMSSDTEPFEGEA